MKVVFVFATPGFLRYFDVTIAALLERGDDVILAFEEPALRADALTIMADWPSQPEILGRAPERAGTGWQAPPESAARRRALTPFVADDRELPRRDTARSRGRLAARHGCIRPN
jgi:hypothetical protein